MGPAARRERSVSRRHPFAAEVSAGFRRVRRRGKETDVCDLRTVRIGSCRTDVGARRRRRHALDGSARPDGLLARALEQAHSRSAAGNDRALVSRDRESELPGALSRTDDGHRTCTPQRHHPYPDRRRDMSTKKTKKPAPKTVLILRTVDRDRKAYGGFVWPEKGEVSCPDWDPAAECGNGLHGWLRGEGDSQSIAGWSWSRADERLWQVVEVVEADIIDLSGKVKFPRGVVLYTGDRATATKMISDAYPGAAVIGGVVTAGNSGTATAGYAGTATAGNLSL